MKLKNNMKRIISIVFAVVMTVGVGTAIFLSTGINAKAAVSSVSDDRTFSTVYFNVPETIYLVPGGTAFQYALDQTFNSTTLDITANSGYKTFIGDNLVDPITFFTGSGGNSNFSNNKGTVSFKSTSADDFSIPSHNDNSTKMAVTPGKVYEISFDYNLSAASNLEVMLFHYSSATANWDNSTKARPTVSCNAGTGRYSYTFTAKSGFPYVSFRLGIRTNGVTCTFSNISMREVYSNNYANVDFYCSTASNISISTSGASSLNLSSISASGNKLSSHLTSGSMASSANGTITWTATYTDSIDNKTKTATAYTYVYSPYTRAVAAVAQGTDSSGTSNRGATVSTAIYGVHKITASNFTSYTIGKTAGTCGDRDGSAVYYRDLTTWSTTPIANSNTFSRPACLLIGSDSNNDAAIGCSYWYKGSSSGAQESANVGGGIGTVYFDSSRSTKIGDIPNFHVFGYLHGLNSTGDVSGGAYWGKYGLNGKDEVQYASGTHLSTGQKKLDPDSATSNKLYDQTVSDGTNLVVSVRHDWKRKAGKYSQAQAQVNFVGVSKSTLRSTLAIARKASFDKSLYSDSVVDTFYTRLQEATSALGNPTATQTEVDTAKTNLTNAVNAFNSANFKKSTATAEYYSTDNGVTTEIDNSLTSSFVKSLEYKYGDKVTCTADPVNGFDFNGKIEAFNGSTKVAETTSNSLTVNYVNYPNLKFKIYYKPKTYTATFDINKPGLSEVVVATGDTSVSNCKPNQVMPQSITPPQIKGYNFTGYWSTKTDESGVKYYDESGNPTAEVVKFTSDTTLYAHWAKKQWYADLNWYLDGVSYNNNPKVATADVYINGVSKANDVTDYWTQWLYGDKFEIKDVKPVKGYSYTGVHSNNCTDPHNDKANPYGYIPAETNCSINLDIITNKYNLVFDNNGKAVTTSGTASRENVKFNDAVSKISVPSLTGYTFDGFYTHKSGGTQVFDNSGNLVTNTWTLDPGYDSFDTVSYNGEYKAAYPGTNGATITLYAHWTANNYTVTYNGNGNDGGATANSSHTYDVEKALNANGFTKTGYSFAGWATSAGGNVVYANKAAVKNLTTVNGGTVTLYAKWTINQYTLAVNWDYTDASGTKNGFDPTGIADLTVVINGVTTASNITEYEVKHNYGTSFKVDGRVLDPDKYTFYMNNGSNIFKTWSYGSNIPAERTDLNFHIRPVYNVVFSLGDTPESPADAFAGAVTKTRVCFGTTVTVPTGTPTRAGYTFAGWVDRNGSPVAGGSPVTIKPGTDLAPGGDYIIKATWTAKTYRVTFDEQMIDDSGKDLTPYNLFNLSDGAKIDNSYGSTLTYNKTDDTKGRFHVYGTASDSVLSDYDIRDDHSFMDTEIWNAQDFIFIASNKAGSFDDAWLFFILDSKNRDDRDDDNNQDKYNSRVVMQRFEYGQETFPYIIARDVTGAYLKDKNNQIYYSSYNGDRIHYRLFFDTNRDEKQDYYCDLSLYHGFDNQQFDAVMRKSVKVPSWGDHVFEGYFSQPNGKGTKYYNADGTPTGNAFHESNAGVNDVVRLYACWRNKSFYFDVNGKLDGKVEGNITGYGKVDVIINGETVGSQISDYYQMHPYGSSFEINNITEETGHTYDGYVDMNGVEHTGEHRFDKIADNTENRDVSVQLIFHTNTYKVVFNKDKNSEREQTQHTQDFKYGVGQNLWSNTFTKTFTVTFNYKGADLAAGDATKTINCNLDGWSYMTDGSTKDFAPNQYVTSLSAIDLDVINLYAVWKNGDVTLPAPAKLGYIFGGWYTDEACTYKAGDANGSYHPTDDCTLYAKWNKIEANEIYIPVDFTSGDNNAKVEYKISLDGTNPTIPEESPITINTTLNSGVKIGTSTTGGVLGGQTGTEYSGNGFTAKVDGAKLKDATITVKVGKFTGNQEFYYETNVNERGYNQYITGKVVLVPANNVYHSDAEFSLNTDSVGAALDLDSNSVATWSYQDAKPDGPQKPVPPAEKDSPYGFNKSYELYEGDNHTNYRFAAAMVSSTTPVSKTMEYEFTGKGFELYGICGDRSSVIMVYVWAKDGDNYIPVANAAVDTYFEEGRLITSDSSDYNYQFLRQAPIYHFTTSEVGTYLVQAFAVYTNEFVKSTSAPLTTTSVADTMQELGFNVQENLFELQWLDEDSVFNGGTGSAELKTDNTAKSSLNKSTAKPANLQASIDGIRVYNPAATSGSFAKGYDACYNADEKNARFFNLRQFTKIESNEYTGFSINSAEANPINEVYLDKGGYTAFKVSDFGAGNTAMLSMRAPKGEINVTVYPTSGKTNGVNIHVKSATEMYYDITKAVGEDGMIYIVNNSDKPVALCNLKLAGVALENTEPSLTALSLEEFNAAMLFMSKSTSPCENEYSYTSPGVVGNALENKFVSPGELVPFVEDQPGTGDEPGTGEDEPTQPTDPTVKYNLPDLREQSAGYGSRVTVSVPVKNLPAGCIVKIDGTEVPVVDGYASKGLGQLKGNKTFTVQVLSGGKVISEKQGTVKVASGFFDKLVAIIRFIFSFFKWKEAIIKF